MLFPHDAPNAPNGHSLIQVQLALVSITSAETLTELRNRRKRTDTHEHQALWDGIWLLREDAISRVAQARDRGHLLFCFPGTTVLQQGGAQ